MGREVEIPIQEQCVEGRARLECVTIILRSRRIIGSGFLPFSFPLLFIFVIACARVLVENLINLGISYLTCQLPDHRAFVLASFGRRRYS